MGTSACREEGDAAAWMQDGNSAVTLSRGAAYPSHSFDEQNTGKHANLLKTYDFFLFFFFLVDYLQVPGVSGGG